jgi:hypothetical protein
MLSWPFSLKENGTATIFPLHINRRNALYDPTASDYFVFLIEDGGLAGGDGSLGLVEEGVDGVVVDAAERGHGWGVAMADLCADSDGFSFGEAWDGDPVEAVGEEVAGEEIFVGSYSDLVRVGVNGEDVERVSAGEAEALALADGEALNAFVVADDLACGGD